MDFFKKEQKIQVKVLFGQLGQIWSLFCQILPLRGQGQPSMVFYLLICKEQLRMGAKKIQNFTEILAGFPQSQSVKTIHNSIAMILNHVKTSYSKQQKIALMNAQCLVLFIPILPGLQRDIVTGGRGEGGIMAPLLLQLWIYQQPKTEALHIFYSKSNLKSHIEQFQAPLFSHQRGEISEDIIRGHS